MIMPPTSPAMFYTPPLCYSLAHPPTSRTITSMRNIYNGMSMLCATKHTKCCVFICICMIILTWNGCLRELNAAIPETDLVLGINEQTLHNTVNALLWTLFIT